MTKCINGCIREGAKSHGMCSNCVKRGKLPPKRRNLGWQINNDKQKMCSRCKKIFSIEDIQKWTHKSRCLDCQSIVKRELYLQQHYGISIEEYTKMLDKNSGGCYICGRTKKENSGKNLSVDHDHSCCNKEKGSCGKCVRGLLCDKCNRAIGLLDDNYNSAINLANYLKNTRQ